jgi:two-component system cell cycle response regulator CtrA
MRVLVVDDDIHTSKALREFFKSKGAAIDLAETGEEALDLAKHYEYDLIMLDVLLPDMEGYDVLRKLRGSKIGTPVLMMSGLSRAQAKIKGLELGADDYITKPYEREEVLARANAVIRRSRGFSHNIITAGRIQINIESMEVSVEDKIVHLTSKEYSILELLILRKGVALTKEVFLNHLYGGLDEPDGKIIDVFICKLRKKLSALGLNDLITTVWGKGYMIKKMHDTIAGANDPSNNQPASHSPIPLYLPVAGRDEAGEAIAGREPVFPSGDRARK